MVETISILNYSDLLFGNGSEQEKKRKKRKRFSLLFGRQWYQETRNSWETDRYKQLVLRCSGIDEGRGRERERRPSERGNIERESRESEWVAYCACGEVRGSKSRKRERERDTRTNTSCCLCYTLPRETGMFYETCLLGHQYRGFIRPFGLHFVISTNAPDKFVIIVVGAFTSNIFISSLRDT